MTNPVVQFLIESGGLFMFLLLDFDIPTFCMFFFGTLFVCTLIYTE